jgi:hypothetical protein
VAMRGDVRDVAEGDSDEQVDDPVGERRSGHRRWTSV